MKVTCQQCGAAYSVADSKIAGRKAKLRCKQCNEAMIIDGTAVRADAHQSEPEPVASAVDASVSTVSEESGLEPVSASGLAVSGAALEVEALHGEAHAEDAHEVADEGAYADADEDAHEVAEEGADADHDHDHDHDAMAAGWHIAVGDETQGPYSLEEVARYYADGRIAVDTLVYCDGASDWQPAGVIAELTRAAVAFSSQATKPTVPPPRRAEPRRPEPVAVAMGRDPFEDRAASSPRVDSEDMFGPAHHEGTVQFSLDQIRAISSVSAPGVMPVAAAAALGARSASPNYYLSAGLTSPGYASPGYASGEGSGLIDVSAFSSQQQDESPFHVISNAQRSPLDAHTPFGVLIEARNSGVDARTKVFAGLSAFGLVLAAGVTVLALTRVPAARPAAVSAVEPIQASVVAMPTEQLAAEPIAPKVAKPRAAEAIAAAEIAAVAPRGAAASGPEATRIASKERTQARVVHPSGKRASAEVVAKAPSTTEPKQAKEPKVKAGAKASASADIDDLLASVPTKKPAAKGGDSIDDLLDSAVSAKKQPPKAEQAAAAAPASGLPVSPSRDAMLAAFGKAKAKTAKCKGPGVATADITIAGSTGRVSSVAVSGVEGAGKACVESAVRGTAFPKFQKDAFQVKFPFKLAD